MNIVEETTRRFTVELTEDEAFLIRDVIGSCVGAGHLYIEFRRMLGEAEAERKRYEILQGSVVPEIRRVG